MATALIAKSAIRENNNISVGYGEVPAVGFINGKIAWGLPNGELTADANTAREFASKLDATIRANLRDVKQLMVSKALG